MGNFLSHKKYIINEMDNGVLHWHFHSGELELNEYLEAYNFGLEAKDKHPFFVLATHDQGFHFSSETWNFMIDKKTDFYLDYLWR